MMLISLPILWSIMVIHKHLHFWAVISICWYLPGRLTSNHSRLDVATHCLWFASWREPLRYQSLLWASIPNWLQLRYVDYSMSLVCSLLVGDTPVIYCLVICPSFVGLLIGVIDNQHMLSYSFKARDVCCCWSWLLNQTPLLCFFP